MANLYFRPDYESIGMKGMQVFFYCRFCNEHVNVTGLVYALLQYGLKDCPTHLYQAWKILRMGSLEYADRPDQEHAIIRVAADAFREARGIDG